MEVIRISNDKAFEFCRIISRQNALFLGISSGAAIAAAYETAKKLGKGKKVLAVSPDGGEKYLSTDVYK